MEDYEGIQAKHSQSQLRPSKLRLADTPIINQSLREAIWREFFGTKQDRQKSTYVMSLLMLIVAFFVVSAFSLPLDVILGMVLMCYAIYGGIWWASNSVHLEL